MLVVLSEAVLPSQGISPNAQELAHTTEAARLLGARVIAIPTDFAVSESAVNALAYVGAFVPRAMGIWIGYIPTLARYGELYAAALAKGIRLVNTPTQHQRAMEGDRALRLLRGITPETVVVTSVEQCEAAARELGFPLFVKGAVKSRKEAGWSACVASNIEELRALVEATLLNAPMTRGRALVRRLVPLRRLEGTIGDFPISREYRVFLYRQRVLAFGFYWQDYADLQTLSASDEQALRTLASEAARRLNVPFLIVDVGQMASGEWTVIEAGDAQFAGLSKVSPLALWSQLIERIG